METLLFTAMPNPTKHHIKSNFNLKTKTCAIISCASTQLTTKTTKIVSFPINSKWGKLFFLYSVLTYKIRIGKSHIKA